MPTVATKGTVKRVSAAQAFRDSIKLKLTDEQLIARVRKISGSKTFDAKHLAWYKSMNKAGKLSTKGRAVAASN